MVNNHDHYIRVYSILQRGFKYFFVESRDVSYCPHCGSDLHYRDTCLRIWLKEGHERRTIAIRRLKCQKCGTLHRELPDLLTPYKHYETELISGVLDGVVGPEDVLSDLPCETTMHNWHHWLMANELRIDGFLRSEGSRLPGFTEELLMAGMSLLKQLRSSCPGWLEAIYSASFIIPAVSWCRPGLSHMHRLLCEVIPKIW